VKLNGISKIKNDMGDYIVLTDNGMDGISVSYQAKTTSDALHWVLSSGYCGVHSIVKLVNVEVANCDMYII